MPVIVAVASVFFFLSCGGQKNSPLHRMFSTVSETAEAEMLELEAGDQTFFIRSYPFEGMGKSKPVQIERGMRLLFFPFADTERAGSLLFELYAIGKAKTERIAMCSTVSTEPLAVTGDTEAYKVFGRKQIVDLEPFAGRTIRFGWLLRDSQEGTVAETGGAAGLMKLIPAKEEQTTALPPILFVCSDTHRYDHAFGAKGEELTPFLQDLRRQSVTYHKAYSSASWTVPSIASILTGLSPRFHRTGERIEVGPFEELKDRQIAPGQFLMNLGPKSLILRAYPKQHRSLPEYLQEAGYLNLMVCSNGVMILSGLHVDGWDIVLDIGTPPGEEVNRRFFEFLDQWSLDQPLFCWLHYMDAHQQSFWCFEADEEQTNQPGAKWKEWNDCYAQSCRDVDSALAELVYRWDAEFGLDETLLAFFADHGEHLPQQEAQYTIGHGNSMAECLLHVPLVIKYPAVMGMGCQQIEATVSLLDLLPTTLDCLGIQWDSSLHEGLSLPGKDSHSIPQRYLFADYQLRRNDLSSVRYQPHKLVIDHELEKRQLFNAALPDMEPGEMDLLEDNPKRQKQLSESFDNYARRSASVAADVSSDFDVDIEEALDKLRDLGYTAD